MEHNNSHDHVLPPSVREDIGYVPANDETTKKIRAILEGQSSDQTVVAESGAITNAQEALPSGWETYRRLSTAQREVGKAAVKKLREEYLKIKG